METQLIQSGGIQAAPEYYDQFAPPFLSDQRVPFELVSAGKSTTSQTAEIPRKSYHIASGMTSTGFVLSKSREMHVSAGGVVKSASVDDSQLYISDGGTADGIKIISGGLLELTDGGKAYRTTVCIEGTADAGYGSLLYQTTVSSGGVMRVFGTANGVNILDGGALTVFSGGILSGSIHVEGGAEVNFYEGGTLDFTIAGSKNPAVFLVNDLSRFGKDAAFTITVSRDQRPGRYALARSAEGFAKTVTVKVDGKNIGNLTLTEPLNTAFGAYNLSLKSGDLMLSVQKSALLKTGNFTGKGGVLEIYPDGSATVKSLSGTIRVIGTIDLDQWRLVGVGDFNHDGKDGLLWQEAATGELYVQNDLTRFDEISCKTDRLGIIGKGYEVIGAGDFSGTGFDGILMKGPAFGDPGVSQNYGLPVWARGTDGSIYNGWLGALSNTWESGKTLAGDPSNQQDINAKNFKFDVVGIGDFNGDGVDDVLLQNIIPESVNGIKVPGAGDIFTFFTGDKEAVKAGKAPGVAYTGRTVDQWKVVATGDFDGDRTDDIILSDGQGIAGWNIKNGQRTKDFWFGKLSDHEEFVGVMDYDNDGKADIVVRNTMTNETIVWLSGDGSKLTLAAE